MADEKPESPPDKSRSVALDEKFFEALDYGGEPGHQTLFSHLERALECARDLRERTLRSLTPKERAIFERHRPELFPKDEERAADAAEAEPEPKSS